MSKSQNPLKVADRYLLSPYGLGEAEIEKTFRKLMRHDIDFADLYFQYQRSEAWSLEEGIVKSGSFDIEQGVGVRAVAGDKTAFSYSDDISEAALLEAALTHRSAGRRNYERLEFVGDAVLKLVAHARSHTGERPFACAVDGCGFAAASTRAPVAARRPPGGRFRRRRRASFHSAGRR